MTHWTELINNKLVKFVLVILLLLLCITVIVGLISDKHIKVFGLEFNEKEKADTSILITNKTVPVEVKTSSKKDQSASSLDLKQKNNSGDNIAVQKSNNTVQGDNNKTHIVYGNNSGVNGDVTVNNGIKQRHLNTVLMNRIKAFLPEDNSNPIQVKFSFDDKESYNFGMEVIDFLNKLGHSTVKGIGTMPFTDSVLLTKADTNYYIGIAKTSNIPE